MDMLKYSHDQPYCKGGTAMLDQKGFDLWADGYDKAVGLSDEEQTYPFAG